MKRVWKFPILMMDEQRLEIPFGSKPLYVGLDPSGNPCIWYEVNPQETVSQVMFYVVGTGNPIPTRVNIYLGSFVHGSFVWHVYV